MALHSLRRYRAERLVRDEFDALRARVLASVAGRLRAKGPPPDRSDLEECYAQAWQGLYMTLLEGQEVANPAGWLVVATFRRAIEDQRSRSRAHGHDMTAGACEGLEDQPAAGGRDLVEDLQDRLTLRSMFEGIGQLSERERAAAVLCYLQGLSRSEAARRLGLSEAGMRKLMEGPGGGRPGVAAKVGRFAERIRAGRWCEEQASLMRGLAYGVLDPAGERYRLAQTHRRECPACRAYVRSLRGLAAVMPPALTPTLLPTFGSTAAARAPAGSLGGAHGGAAGGGCVPIASGVGAASGAGGAATVGGWGAAIGSKIAVGCLLALGVGVGCLPLYHGGRQSEHAPDGGPGARHRPPARSAAPAALAAGASPASMAARGAAGSTGSGRLGARRSSRREVAGASAAAREFGPENGAVSGGAGGGSAVTAPGGASARSASRSAADPSSALAPDGPARSAPAGSSGGSTAAAAPAPAEREFSPG